MATPPGPRADAARDFFRRERRRHKQNEKAFAALAAAPFDFGAAAAGAGAPNLLALPASGRFAFSLNAAIPVGGVAVSSTIGGTVGYFNDVSVAPGGFYNVKHYFEEPETIGVFRDIATPAGTLSLYYLGPRGKRLLIGTATFT